MEERFDRIPFLGSCVLDLKDGKKTHITYDWTTNNIYCCKIFSQYEIFPCATFLPYDISSYFVTSNKNWLQFNHLNFKKSKEQRHEQSLKIITFSTEIPFFFTFCNLFVNLQTSKTSNKESYFSYPTNFLPKVVYMLASSSNFQLILLWNMF